MSQRLLISLETLYTPWKNQEIRDLKCDLWRDTAQKMKFSIKDLFSKCDQIRRKLQIWSHLLKKY